MKSTPKRTIENLESDKWTESPDDTPLISRCLALRRKPLDEFTTENLRIMIGQNIGLPHLIPLALDRLERNPFVEGDFYPGDLLGVVLRAERAFWLASPAELVRAQKVAARALKRLRRFKTTDGITTRLITWAEDLLVLRPAASG